MKVLFICFFMLFVYSHAVFAADFTEGEDYRVVKGGAANVSGSVVEFFSYVCSYCYRAESVMAELEQEYPEKVSLERIPVHLGKSKYKAASHAWFIYKELGLDAEVHQHLYDVAHAHFGEEWKYNSLRYIEDIQKYFVEIGVSKDAYEKALSKISSKGLVDKANDLAKEYMVPGTPTFLIKGKYIVEGIDSGPYGRKKLKSLIVYLLHL